AYVPRYYRRDDDAYYAPNSDQIYDLNAADPARLWISSFDGSLSYVDLSDDSRQFISRKNRIPFPAQQLNRMRHSCFGPDGKLYASGSLGLFVCDNPSDEPEQMKFEHFPSTADFDIQHILFTADGMLWASSSGNGFIGFDGTGSDSRAEFYTTREGILSNFVLSAVQDRKGNIWIASNGGINKFNPQTNSIIGYPYSRIGLDVQLNEGRPILADNGEIFFNTTGGLLHFNPDEISNSTYVPRLLISFMSVNGRQKDEDTFDRVRMKRNQTLDLRFLALDLAAPSRVLYYYKVDGLDEDWHNLGNDPFIHLSDLKPGRYTLRLRSTNADGIAVDNERTIRLDVGGGILLLSLLLPPLLLGAAAAAVFLHLRRRASRAAAAPQPFRDSLTAFLEEHIDDGDLSIADVAAAMNMSRSSLFQKCRDKLKMTPLEYLKELRFRKAAEMLQEGSHSISQIAWATGFNDSHYFSRAFKQRFGKTPSEYRNSARRGGGDRSRN
ncbi:MAG: helix-turn-helix domain-containing protein, partial [Bacteroidetes bacterium]|nr:helix-turn-helix domain-containing protein [Candidatus Cryptobacteroides avistercoris]